MADQVHRDVVKGIAVTLGFKPKEVTEIRITPSEVVVTCFGNPKFKSLPHIGEPNLIEHHIKVVHDA